MKLADQLKEAYDGLHASVPTDVSQLIKQSTADFVDGFDANQIVRAGQTMPAFRLNDATGKVVSSEDLLSRGPLLISFYRGEWCPYCNLALQSLQQHLPEIEAKGVTLIAITPELPDQSLTPQEKEALRFPVLSDVGNKLARQLGIVFKQPDSMRLVFDFARVDLSARNGDDSYEVPIPASYLVDRNGVIRNAFVDPDYTKRLEPSTALSWIDALGAH